MKRSKVPDYKDKHVFGVPPIVNVQRTGQPLPQSIQQAMRYLRSQCLEKVCMQANTLTNTLFFFFFLSFLSLIPLYRWEYSGNQGLNPGSRPSGSSMKIPLIMWPTRANQLMMWLTWLNSTLGICLNPCSPPSLQTLFYMLTSVSDTHSLTFFLVFTSSHFFLTHHCFSKLYNSLPRVCVFVCV